MKIETGVRASFRNFTSFTNNYAQDSTGKLVLNTKSSNDYKFDDALYAGYLTFSHQLKKLSYQLGLRVESSSYNGKLINKNQKFKTDYPLSLFPSAFVTYKVNDKVDVQLNYSRKINRPNFFQLIPFVDYSDSLNLSVGNPALVPEFTNLLELSYSNQYKAGNSFLATLYFRNTDNLITRYQYKDVNPGQTKPDSVYFITYANANRAYTIGFEITGKNKLAKWWDLTTNVNLFNSTIQAGNLPGSANSSLFSWFAKINNNFKLPKNFSVQLSGDYTAKTLVSPSSGGGGNRGGMGGGMMFGGGSQPSSQGYIKPVFGADFSIRKEFLKNNAASITLQFSDIFRTKIYATHADGPTFIQDNERRRDPQFVRLNFNWRFGKIDVSLFKKKNMKGEMENMQNAQQGMGGN
jgi:outer membrane receptor protein involved in Fe transport